MKLGNSPEISGMWTKGLLSKLPFLPGKSEIQRIKAISAGVIKDANPSPAFWRSTTSVAIVTRFYGDLLGGTVSQILKCLTAIKICDELAAQGISAAPVCWIRSAPPGGSSQWSLFLLDHKYELQALELSRSRPGDFCARDSLPGNQITSLLKQIEEMGKDTFDSEVLEILRNAYYPDATFSSAAANLVKALMQEWGMLVFEGESPATQRALFAGLSQDSRQPEKIQSLARRYLIKEEKEGYTENPSADAVPSCLIPSLAMPILAAVVDAGEILEYEKAAPLFEELGLVRPVMWPQCSATIFDGRSRNTLNRFNLNLQQLFSGEAAALEVIKEGMRYSTPDALRGLQAEVRRCLEELCALDFPGNALAETAITCKERVLYQLEKVRRQCERAIGIKEDAAKRRLHRACNFLAPRGLLQELVLGGIQIPLRYSRAGLRSVYEKLDVWKFEHQLIEMD